MLSIEVKQFSSFQWREGRPFKNCPKDPMNHAITIVGQTEKQDWIIRNSWGSSFGINGYILLKKGNTCSVCRHAFVPYLKGFE